MENNKPDLEEVNAFLEGKMNEEERVRFEKNLTTDALFAREFQLKKALLGGMEDYFSNQLKKRLQQEEKPITGNSRRLKIYRIAAIAASIVLILFSTFQIWFSVTSHEAIFAEFYQPYPNVVDGTERQMSEETLSPFQIYENKDYEKAITTFKNELALDPEDVALNFYMALSHLAMGNAGEAIPFLEKNQSGPKEDELLEANEWFLALAYLKAGHRENAMNLFSEISGSSSSYQESAKKVMEKLK